MTTWLTPNSGMTCRRSAFAKPVSTGFTALKDGHWYYEYCTSDREQEDFEDENVTYVMCIRMPDSLNDKLNKNYIRGW